MHRRYRQGLLIPSAAKALSLGKAGNKGDSFSDHNPKGTGPSATLQARARIAVWGSRAAFSCMFPRMFLLMFSGG